MKNFILGLLATLSIAACSRSSDSPPKPTASTKQVTINGEKPEDYFNRFLYHTTGKCSDHTIFFNFLSSRDIQLEDHENGKPMLAALEVFLSKDNSYVANYEERLVEEYTREGYTYEVVFRKRLTGPWKVTEDGLLNLDTFGIGTAITYNEKRRVSLKVASNIHQGGLKGQSVILGMVSSTGTRELYDSFCRK